MENIIIAIATAISTVILTYFITIRSIRARHVIEERQKWRDNLKEKIALFFDDSDESKLSKEGILAFLKGNLNPYIETEMQMYNKMVQYAKTNDNGLKKEILDEFNELMKYDWEKSKIETSFFPWNAEHRAKVKCFIKKKKMKDKLSLREVPNSNTTTSKIKKLKLLCCFKLAKFILLCATVLFGYFSLLNYLFLSLDCYQLIFKMFIMFLVSYIIIILVLYGVMIKVYKKKSGQI